MICPNCGFNIIDNSPICPNCKSDLSAAFAFHKESAPHVAKKRGKTAPVIIAVSIIAVILIFATILVFVISKNTDTKAPQETTAVKLTTQTAKEYGKLTYKIVRHADKINTATGTEPCGVACFEDGEPLWEYTENAPLGLFDEVCNDIPYDEKNIFVSVAGNLTALDKFTGDVVWRIENIGNIFSILMDENHLYIAGSEGLSIDVLLKDGTLIEDDIKPFTGRITAIEFSDNNTIKVTYLPQFDGSDTEVFYIDITQYKNAETPINPNNTNNLLIYPMSYDFLSAEGNIDYRADNVLDGDPKTVWSEGKSGIGTGAELAFTVAGGKEINGIKILAGHNKTEALYYYNCRPSQIKISDTNGNTELINLSDKYGEYQTINFTKPMTGTITITIIDAYHGTVYEDTCISEITAF